VLDGREVVACHRWVVDEEQQQGWDETEDTRPVFDNAL
jgi:hypothetical protein